jgi:tRNA pseudouridine55 synthase
VNKPRRAPRRRIDGVLLFDKPAGVTSNTALQIVRRLFNAEKAGHTGTLDPMATGLLPVCFGEATKYSGELLDADKAYRATLRFGVTTDSGDADGQVVCERPVAIAAGQLEAAIGRFLGDIDQVPPMHSALKRDGKPLYEYARAGIEIERAPRRVTIRAIELLNRDESTAMLEVRCSKGTYIRTLAADIGELLGCGAHLTALRRLATGGVELANAFDLPTLEWMTESERDAALLPVDTLLERLPSIVLSAGESTRLRLGQTVPWTGEGRGRCRVYGPDGTFLGTGDAAGDGWLRPGRLLATTNP